MIWLVVISFLIFALYTSIVCIKNKDIPWSISATYYTLEHRYWFAFSMMTPTLLLIAPALEASGSGSEFLAFLSVSGMLLVGISPNYREDKMENIVHNTGAYITAAFSQIWMMINCPILLFHWAIYFPLLAKYFIKKTDFKPVFWAEIGLFNVWIYLILKYL